MYKSYEFGLYGVIHSLVGMGDIDILVCNYCEAKLYVYHNYCLYYIYSETCLQTCQTVYKCV